MKYSNGRVEIRKTVEQDKPFPGKVIEQMPRLLEEERSPWYVAHFAKERIAHAHEFPDLRSYLYVSDLIAYDSDERSTDVKFILTVDKNRRVTGKGREALELINTDAEWTSDYALRLSNELYDSLPGIVVARADLGVLGRNLTEAEALESKALRILLRHPSEVPPEFAEDPQLLREYLGWVKGQTKQDTNTGVYFDVNSNVAKLRVWFVNGLGSRSDAFGRLNLVYGLGRFVGHLAPEARDASGNVRQGITADHGEESGF